MNSTERRTEFMRRYAIFYMIAASEGIRLLPYSFYRTAKEQYKLYMKGKSKRDGKTKISMHQKWLAIDNSVINDDSSLCWNGADARYSRLNKIAKLVGLETGYEWHVKDSNHVQWPEGT